MAKDPAFLFYTQDFIVGVQTMNFEDRGKYITILCQMHQQGRMDEETIRFLVGSVSDKLRLKFKVDENGLWFNQRLEEETARRGAFTESRRNNGKNGGRPKKEKPNVKPTDNHKQNHMDNHMGNENESVNEDEIELRLNEALNEIYIDQQRPKWSHIDFDYEYRTFCEKVRGAPEHYKDHKKSGIVLAFQKQLREAKHKRNGTTKNDRTQFNQTELERIMRHSSGS